VKRESRRLPVRAAAALALVAAGAAAWLLRGAHAPGPSPVATGAPAAMPAYVGSDACGSCHAEQHAAWRTSQHALAMQAPTPATVLGDFGGATFRRDGLEARFFRDGDAFKVHTEGADGAPADYRVRYAFGIYPLQQYLIEFPGGRLQSLTIAWDSRERERGGQRWFDLYAGQRHRPGDPLHWTGIDQNWNYQCADCHSTNVRKNLDPETGRFDTTWSEVNVACEACHGPGEAHVSWAQSSPRPDAASAAEAGLVATLDERRGVGWSIDAGSGSARRSVPRTTSVEIEVCARCHARRGQFSDDHAAGQPFHDAFRPALIEPGLYWPDGQMRDEVYNYGSFLTSRMAAQGVTCSDCHEPHGGRLRAPGNSVCAQCHLAQKYDARQHHRHDASGTGGQCAACHMPTTTYMVVDPRHDHSFRIPRPDRSVALGVPNACNACHDDRGADWAAAAVAAWYREPRPGFQTFAETFAAADRGDGRARPSLIALAEDPAQPAIVRASALWRLGQDPRPDMLVAVRRALNDADPAVRAAAADAMSRTEPAVVADVLRPRLDDPSRLVRMAVASALAGPSEARLDAAARAQFEAALAEYVAAQRFNADRPEARSNLGALHMNRGAVAAAETEFRAAIGLDPTFVPAWVNLAELQRTQGQEDQAARTLREALGRNPGDATLRHSLGLSLVRSGDTRKALIELEAAARAAPDVVRYGYVLAIALHSAGREREAIARLEALLERNPANRDVLMALAGIHLDAGRREDARRYAALLAGSYPDDPEVSQLLQATR